MLRGAQTAQQCPLCYSTHNTLFAQDKRDYYRCLKCALVFVPYKQFLSLEAEKAIYDQHENSLDDQGYLHFLKRLFIPLSSLLTTPKAGLDFGCGSGPALAAMCEAAGHTMMLYDPVYAPNIKALQQSYDFITATEVVEHLHDPNTELKRLWACLKPGGILAIMTKRVLDQEAFSHWHYKNDLTHVIFFSETTFQWLAQHWQAQLLIPEKDVVIFIKSG